MTSRFIVAVVIHAHPIAYAEASNRPDSQATAFGEAMIHGTTASRYTRSPIVWGNLPRGPVDDRERWTAWHVKGRPVAWTLDGADERLIGPLLRFGMIGGLGLDGARLKLVRLAHVTADQPDEAKPARTFAHLLDAQARRPLREFPTRATLRVRDGDPTDSRTPGDREGDVEGRGLAGAQGARGHGHRGGARDGGPPPVHVQDPERLGHDPGRDLPVPVPAS